MKYLIEIPKDKWDFRDCIECVHENTEAGKCGVADFNNCPLENAMEAKEITNSLSMALQTHDGVKIYAVEEKTG